MYTSQEIMDRPLNPSNKPSLDSAHFLLLTTELAHEIHFSLNTANTRQSTTKLAGH
jgi:hypothetical protein